ncbi:MAG: nucleotidyltransferase domain-containing protein [Mycobacterium leprae]
MLDDISADQIRVYFDQHPVFSRYASQVCFALTGSYAVGLGGRGADVDVLVLCPGALYEAVKHELAAAGRIGEGDEPEEEFADLVGDYSLESLTTIWQRVQRYDDMTALFIYGNLVYLAGNRELLDLLVSHCRQIPPAALREAVEQARGMMGQGIYAYLRSFQNADSVARLLARAEIVRQAMRLAFLGEGMAPPYDKHLFRLLPGLTPGEQLSGLIRQFLDESVEVAEAAAYGAAAATADWHAMYGVAGQTPVLRFQSEVLRLLGLS